MNFQNTRPGMCGEEARKLRCARCNKVDQWIDQSAAKCSRCGSRGPFYIVKGDDCQIRMARYEELCSRAEAI